MAGVAIFDCVLAAYPLYQTSKHVLDTRHLDADVDTDLDPAHIHASNRWLTFWLTFGLVEIIQGFGADGIPGFHLAKGLTLLSLYSVEHGTLVSAFMPKVCEKYIDGVDRAYNWWNESAVPGVQNTVVNTGWLTSAKNKVYGMIGWEKSEEHGESETKDD